MDGLAQSFILSLDAVVSSPLIQSVFYTQLMNTQIIEVLQLWIKIISFSRKMKMWNPVFKHHVWKSLLEHVQVLVQWIF